MNKFISYLTGAIVLFVGGAAFALSFDNLRSLALANGITPGLVALWPCLLDAFVIACALTVLRGSVMNERTRFAWVLLFAFTGLSITFNVITFNSWLAGAIHGLPALVNFLSIELLTGQLKSTVKRHGMAQTLSVMESAVTRARQELADLERQADEHDKALSPDVAPGNDKQTTSVARDIFITTYRDNGHKSVAELSRELGVNVRTAQRWVRAGV